MQAMIWAGALVSLVGVAGLVYCVLRALRARRAGLQDEAMRAELQRVVVINMGALAVSALGLMLVVLRRDLRQWAVEDQALWAPHPLIDRLIADGKQLSDLEG